LRSTSSGSGLVFRHRTIVETVARSFESELKQELGEGMRKDVVKRPLPSTRQLPKKVGE